MEQRKQFMAIILLIVIAMPFISSCSKDDDGDDITASKLYGVWNIKSIEDDSGLIEYGKGAYIDTSIKFTLNEDGTYSWITDDANAGAALPVKIAGTFSYSESKQILKLTGKMTVGPITYNESHLYTVTKLTSSTLVFEEDNKLSSYGVEKTICERIK